MAEKPEDLNLPNAVITRIIKEALPDGVNVSKDARIAISKAASVFVLYATSCANNFALQSKRKTISGKDVLDAMEEMEFEKFVDPLKDSLEAYKKEQKTRKETSANKKKEAAGTSPSKETEEKENSATGTNENGASEDVQVIEDEAEEAEEGGDGGDD